MRKGACGTDRLSLRVPDDGAERLGVCRVSSRSFLSGTSLPRSHGLVHEPFVFPVGPVNDKGRYP